MDKFIQDNISAIFALIGTFVGAALTFYGTWILQRAESKNRLLEKVLDKRILAHEQIIQLAQNMRLMVGVGRIDNNGQIVRTPNIMTSKAVFDDWMTSLAHTSMATTTWLSIEVVRELNLIQDYSITLHENLRLVDPNLYPEIGAIIRQDFIDFSQRLEQLAFRYFTHDLLDLKMKDIKAWHKYKLEETKKRLNSTVFMMKIDEINTLINKGKN